MGPIVLFGALGFMAIFASTHFLHGRNSVGSSPSKRYSFPTLGSFDPPATTEPTPSSLSPMRSKSKMVLIHCSVQLPDLTVVPFRARSQLRGCPFVSPTWVSVTRSPRTFALLPLLPPQLRSPREKRVRTYTKKVLRTKVAGTATNVDLEQKFYDRYRVDFIICLQ